MGTKQFTSYTFGEGHTAVGRLVSFECGTQDGEKEAVRAFFQERIRDLKLPITGMVMTAHGSYGRYTRYDIAQHKYAGGGPGDCGGWGFIEVLEIKNPPDGRWGFVVYEDTSHTGGFFTEWETLADALNAFEKCWSGGPRHCGEAFPKLPGFKRRVRCGQLQPWFYAIGNELLLGDYAIPYGMEDDPVYRLGRKFVVTDQEGVSRVLTCMGTRFFFRKVEEGERYRSRLVEKHFRIISWSDGTYSEEREDAPSNRIRPLEVGEEWIADAMRQFQELLSGRTTSVEIGFLDGSKFVGKFVPVKGRPKWHVAGDYFVEVTIEKDGKELTEKGWVYGFKPSAECRTISKFIELGYVKHGRVVTLKSVKVLRRKTKKGDKKWEGVFFAQPAEPAPRPPTPSRGHS